MKHFSLMIGIAVLASVPAAAAEDPPAEHGTKCEMPCPMREGEKKMDCPMMEHRGDGSGSAGHGTPPQGDGKQAMPHGDGECPMMDHSQTGEAKPGHPHGGEQPAGKQEAGDDEDASQSHDAHEGHTPD